MERESSESNHSRKEISQELLRTLRDYEESIRLTPPGRGSNEWRSIKFSDALSLVSQIGPQQADKVFPNFWGEKRKKAKSQGFGFLYGMGFRKFVAYARDNYDIQVSEREAEQMRREFFDLYASLPGWHQNQRRFAHEHGYVRSLGGRKRRLPMARDKNDSPERGEAFRQAINSPVQGFASDINLMVLLQLRREFPRAVVQPVITVHDSILIEVREDYVERVTHRIEEIMRCPDLFDLFKIRLTVPLEGEVKIGSWGSGISLEKYRHAVRQPNKGRSV